MKPEQWTRILEQIVLVVLILGRWLLPKGRLSRDQGHQTDEWRISLRYFGTIHSKHLTILQADRCQQHKLRSTNMREKRMKL